MKSNIQTSTRNQSLNKIQGERIWVLTPGHGVKPGRCLQKRFLWELKSRYESRSADWIFKLFHPCITHDIKGLAVQGKAARYRASRGKGAAKAPFEWLRCSRETALHSPSPTASLIGGSLGKLSESLGRRVAGRPTAARHLYVARRLRRIQIRLQQAICSSLFLPLRGKKRRRQSICCGLLVDLVHPQERLNLVRVNLLCKISLWLSLGVQTLAPNGEQRTLI